MQRRKERVDAIARVKCSTLAQFEACLSVLVKLTLRFVYAGPKLAGELEVTDRVTGSELDKAAALVPSPLRPHGQLR